MSGLASDSDDYERGVSSDLRTYGSVNRSHSMHWPGRPGQRERNRSWSGCLVNRPDVDRSTHCAVYLADLSKSNENLNIYPE